MISLFIVLCLRLSFVQGTGVIYKEQTSGQCSDSGGGWGQITSKAACGTAQGGSTHIYKAEWTIYQTVPFGCFLDSTTTQNQLFYSAYKPPDGIHQWCSNNHKCRCQKTCTPGTYQDQTGQSSCKSCASGQYSIVGASSCFNSSGTSCPNGTYASGTATVCDACSTGKYNDQTGQTSESACKSCTGGEYQNEEGKASCNNNCAYPMVITLDGRCIDNTVYKVLDEGRCDSEVGMGYITNEDQCLTGAATALGLGTTADPYSLDVLISYKRYYPPGCSVQNGWKVNFNDKDETHTYECQSDTECLCTKTCQPGTYQDQTGQSSCKTCASGQYQDQSGQSSCKTCASGTYSTIGAGQCVDPTLQAVEDLYMSVNRCYMDDNLEVCPKINLETFGCTQLPINQQVVDGSALTLEKLRHLYNSHACTNATFICTHGHLNVTTWECN